MSIAEVGDIKHRLVGWKEVVVLADSVLAWEKVSNELIIHNCFTVLSTSKYMIFIFGNVSMDSKVKLIQRVQLSLKISP